MGLQRNREKEKKEKMKKNKETKLSDNHINVSINIGSEDLIDAGNVTNVTEGEEPVNLDEEIPQPKKDDKLKIDTTELLLTQLQENLKTFNQKKRRLMDNKIDIPNSIFELPDVELKSENEIKNLNELIITKINELDKLLLEFSKKPAQQTQTSMVRPQFPATPSPFISRASPYGFPTMMRPFPTTGAVKPVVKTPAVKTPAVKTPTVKTPEVKTPAVKTPEVKTPTADPPPPYSVDKTSIDNRIKQLNTYKNSIVGTGRAPRVIDFLNKQIDKALQELNKAKSKPDLTKEELDFATSIQVDLDKGSYPAVRAYRIIDRDSVLGPNDKLELKIFENPQLPENVAKQYKLFLNNEIVTSQQLGDYIYNVNGDLYRREDIESEPTDKDAIVPEQPKPASDLVSKFNKLSLTFQKDVNTTDKEELLLLRSRVADLITQARDEDNQTIFQKVVGYDDLIVEKLSMIPDQPTAPVPKPEDEFTETTPVTPEPEPAPVTPQPTAGGRRPTDPSQISDTRRGQLLGYRNSLYYTQRQDIDSIVNILNNEIESALNNANAYITLDLVNGDVPTAIAWRLSFPDSNPRDINEPVMLIANQNLQTGSSRIPYNLRVGNTLVEPSVGNIGFPRLFNELGGSFGPDDFSNQPIQKTFPFRPQQPAEDTFTETTPVTETPPIPTGPWSETFNDDAERAYLTLYNSDLVTTNPNDLTQLSFTRPTLSDGSLANYYILTVDNVDIPQFRFRINDFTLINPNEWAEAVQPTSTEKSDDERREQQDLAFVRTGAGGIPLITRKDIDALSGALASGWESFKETVENSEEFQQQQREAPTAPSRDKFGIIRQP